MSDEKDTTKVNVEVEQSVPAMEKPDDAPEQPDEETGKEPEPKNAD